jgi:cytochrome c-type biogenesis protein CcsB
MAQLSNELLPAAVLCYVAAMLGFLCEYAFGRREAAAPEAARELVAAAIGRDSSGEPVPFTPISPAPPVQGASAPVSPAPASSAQTSPTRPRPLVVDPGRAALFGRIGLWLTGLAAVVHAGVLVTRGLAVGRVPWGNMYEFVIALSLVGAVAFLVLVARLPALRPLGVFVTLALVVLLGLAGMVLYTVAAPLVPALNSYWLKIHVSAAATASGLFLVAFVPAALFLIRHGYEQGRRRFPYSIGARLPESASLERLTFRLHKFAFPIWTFAIICGAIWAESAWGRYWGWDPKEVWSFISWVAYAAYLHARSTPSVKKTTATWLAVVAWGTMLVNLYVINFVAVGLHSYAHVG